MRHDEFLGKFYRRNGERPLGSIKSQNDVGAFFVKNALPTRYHDDYLPTDASTYGKWLKPDNLPSSRLMKKTQENFDGEKLIGGAIGFIQYNWYFLDMLYVDTKYRKKGIATKLITEIEKYSKDKKLTGIRMETWNFQAKGFYEKMGYTVWAQIENCPPGTIDYYLKKNLSE